MPKTKKKKDKRDQQGRPLDAASQKMSEVVRRDRAALEPPVDPEHYAPEWTQSDPAMMRIDRTKQPDPVGMQLSEVERRARDAEADAAANAFAETFGAKLYARDNPPRDVTPTGLPPIDSLEGQRLAAMTPAEAEQWEALKSADNDRRRAETWDRPNDIRARYDGPLHAASHAERWGRRDKLEGEFRPTIEALQRERAGEAVMNLANAARRMYGNANAGATQENIDAQAASAAASRGSLEPYYQPGTQKNIDATASRASAGRNIEPVAPDIRRQPESPMGLDIIAKHNLDRINDDPLRDANLSDAEWHWRPESDRLPEPRGSYAGPYDGPDIRPAGDVVQPQSGRPRTVPYVGDVATEVEANRNRGVEAEVLAKQAARLRAEADVEPVEPVDQPDQLQQQRPQSVNAPVGFARDAIKRRKAAELRQSGAANAEQPDPDWFRRTAERQYTPLTDAESAALEPLPTNPADAIREVSAGFAFDPAAVQQALAPGPKPDFGDPVERMTQRLWRLGAVQQPAESVYAGIERLARLPEGMSRPEVESVNAPAGYARQRRQRIDANRSERLAQEAEANFPDIGAAARLRQMGGAVPVQEGQAPDQPAQFDPLAAEDKANKPYVSGGVGIGSAEEDAYVRSARRLAMMNRANVPVASGSPSVAEPMGPGGGDSTSEFYRNESKYRAAQNPVEPPVSQSSLSNVTGFGGIAFEGEDPAYYGQPNTEDQAWLNQVQRLGRMAEQYVPDESDPYRLRPANQPQSVQAGSRTHVQANKNAIEQAVKSSEMKQATAGMAKSFGPESGTADELIYRYVKPTPKVPDVQKSIQNVRRQVDMRISDRFSGLKPGSFDPDDVAQALQSETLNALLDQGYMSLYDYGNAKIQDRANNTRIGPMDSGSDSSGGQEVWAQMGYTRSEFDALAPKDKAAVLKAHEDNKRQLEQTRMKEEGDNARTKLREQGKDTRLDKMQDRIDDRTMISESGRDSRSENRIRADDERSQRIIDAGNKRSAMTDQRLRDVDAARNDRAKIKDERDVYPEARRLVELDIKSRGWNFQGMPSSELESLVEKYASAIREEWGLEQPVDNEPERGFVDMLDAIP